MIPLVCMLATILVDRATAFSTVVTSPTTQSSTKPSLDKKPDPPPVLLPSGGDEAAFVHSYCNAEECPPTAVPDLELPADFPTGTYFRNGAARFVASDGTKVLHPFDGDGLVSALTIDNDNSNNDNNKVVFRTKFVQTQGYQADMEAGGTFTGRGVFGSPKSGGILANAFDMNPKNLANTNCLYFPDKPEPIHHR